MTTEKFIKILTPWVRKQKDIIGCAYVGSYARETANSESDLDLIIISKNPEELLKSSDWVKKFGTTVKIQKEDWGLLKTWRVFYKQGLEVEFNISSEEWCKTSPVDKGTFRTVSKGMKIIYDPTNLLNNLQEQVLGKSSN